MFTYTEETAQLLKFFPTAALIFSLRISLSPIFFSHITYIRQRFASPALFMRDNAPNKFFFQRRHLHPTKSRRKRRTAQTDLPYSCRRRVESHEKFSQHLLHGSIRHRRSILSGGINKHHFHNLYWER